MMAMRNKVIGEPQHWRGFPGKNGWKAVPMLGFVIVLLGGCVMGPAVPRYELTTEIWVAGQVVQEKTMTVKDGEPFKLNHADDQVSRLFECKIEQFDATTYTLDCDVQLFAKNGEVSRYRRVTPKVYAQFGKAAAFHAADAQDPNGVEWAGLRVVAVRPSPR
jgi:hypothetical protein